MASSIETTSTTTTLKNNGNTYMSVDTSDNVTVTNDISVTDLAVTGNATLTNPLPLASGGTGGTTSATAAAILAPIQLQTAQATTSGTSKDFTSIPAGVKRITVMLSGVSTNGASTPQIQIGSGSITTTGYLSCGSVASGAAIAVTTNSTTGFILGAGGGAADVRHGSAVLSLIGSNIWTIFGTLGYSSGTIACFFGGSITLAGTLDRVRITTINGTDAFDAGSINISWEF